MSRKIKIFYIVMFSFLLCFIFVGYATLTDTLTLTGDIKGEPQKNVFVVDVTVDKDETSKTNIDGFYATEIQQNIELEASNESNTDESYYIVKLYNNSTDEWFYDGYDNNLPDGVTIKIEELVDYNNSTTSTTNIISSLIDPAGYDYFKITFTNTTNNPVVIDQNITLNYTKLTNQIKATLEIGGETYIKYTAPMDDESKTYQDVVFDQINIDLSSESTNRVARCDNNGILSVVNDGDNNYLKISQITDYAGANVGELGVSSKLFDNLTNAINNNEGVFENDITPNNFLVLMNILVDIEPTDINAIIQEDRDYSINMNDHFIRYYSTIQNYGKLKIYDSEKSGGRFIKFFDISTDFVDYTSTHNVKVIENKNLIEHYGNDLERTYLEIYDVTLELIDSVDMYDDLVNDAINLNYAAAYFYEFPAIVVAYDGIVTIKDSSLHTNTGYGVYKKSAYAGNYEERVKNPTNPESKVIIDGCNILSIRNNCVRFADGNGIISIIDSNLTSSMDTTYVPYDNGLEKAGEYKCDPIFVGQHHFEGLNNSTIREKFSEFYEDATTNIKVYLTGGKTYCNNTSHVNHFYSANSLNARLYYTKSSKFYTLGSDNEIYESDVSADTWDTSFTYSNSMINGNGAEDTELFNGELLNRDHYLNNDGWYYIKTGITDEVPNPSDENYDSSYQMQYNTEEYRNNIELTNLTHNNKLVRVGDSFEMINFNNPGNNIIDNTNYDNSISYYSPLNSISENKSMEDYMGFEYQYTFLASCDQNYYNIVSLGNLHETFHIESPSNSIESTNNVGIKYVDTSLRNVTYMPEIDHKNQRFMLMKYMHYNAESDYYSSDDAYPYVFVSKYNSVISYFIAKVAEDEYGNQLWNDDGTPKWNTDVYFADKYFIESGFETVTTPGFLDDVLPYEYAYQFYLLSNVTCPKYQRNGWYLWQDATPTINSKIWNEEYYYNLMSLNYNNEIQNGDNYLDSNTILYISSQALLTDYGTLLQTNFTNDVDTDNYGYLRVKSSSKILGIRLNVVAINTTTTSALPTHGSWLLLRTYSSATLTSGVRLDCKIKYASVSYNQQTGYEDLDGNLEKGDPPYIIIPRSEKDTVISITILFDVDSISSDIYMLDLDPFDFANCNNSIIIKSVCIISDVKDYLK